MDVAQRLLDPNWYNWDNASPLPVAAHSRPPAIREAVGQHVCTDLESPPWALGRRPAVGAARLPWRGLDTDLGARPSPSSNTFVCSTSCQTSPGARTHPHDPTNMLAGQLKPHRALGQSASRSQPRLLGVPRPGVVGILRVAPVQAASSGGAMRE
jgi:hypothetical protein